MTKDPYLDGILNRPAPCSKCNTRKARAPHTCPYRHDVNDDSVTLCDCCNHCSRECAADI